MNRNFIQAKEISETLPALIALDLETTGLDPLIDKIVGFSWSYNSDFGFYSTNFDLLPELCKTQTLVFHNAVFDLSFLKQAKIIPSGNIHDTMLMAHAINPDRESLSLKKLSEELLGAESVKSAFAMWEWLKSNNLNKGDIHKAPEDILLNYAAEDAVNTFDLFHFFKTKFKKYKEYFIKNNLGSKTPAECYFEEDLKLIPVIIDMQMGGVKLDLEQTVARKQELSKQMTHLLTELPYDDKVREAETILTTEKNDKRLKLSKTGILKKPTPRVNFNWDSNDHLKTLFFTVTGEKPKKLTKTGEPSVDLSALEDLAPKYPYINTLVQYRELRKLTTTYLEGLLDSQKAGYIHANFNITGTATGRLSSSNPNMQNLPKHGNIKKLFIPSEGNCFIYADYSQLELRIAAHLSQDPLLIKAYTDNLDLHRFTASVIFDKPEAQITDEERALGKTTNFAIIYRAEGFRIAQILGYLNGVDLENRKEVDKQVNRGTAVAERLFGAYGGLKAYINKQLKFFNQYRFALTECGRMRFLNNINSDIYRERNHDIKAGFNMPVQSLGASITKRAMIQLHNLGYKIKSQIHDAIIIEVPKQNAKKDLDKVREIMENVYSLTVPLKVEPKLLQSFDEKDVYSC